MLKRNIKNNKAGVSVVIGVILMVTIVVAIACTVYVYVSGVMDTAEYIIITDDIINVAKNKYDNYIIESINCTYIISEFQFSYLKHILPFTVNNTVSLSCKVLYNNELRLYDIVIHK